MKKFVETTFSRYTSKVISTNLIYKEKLVLQTIPFYVLNGIGPIIHFAHANAYPPRSYQQMLIQLSRDYYIEAMHLRPLWPNSQPEEMVSWDVVADDLIRFFEQQGLTQVIGIGHSLGAVGTMYAALKRPDLLRALVLIEPVFLPPNLLQMAAANPVAAENMPFVQVARRRRYQWPDRQAAFEHFRSKKVFARWSDEILWDYVRAGLCDSADGGVTLVYSREWEARFYGRPPLTVWEDIPHITQPTLAIRGSESDTLFPDAWQLWQELQPEATFVEMSGVGHMLPMERPLPLAQQIHEFIQNL